MVFYQDLSGCSVVPEVCDLSRAGNLEALLDSVRVSHMSTLLPGSLCECSTAKTDWAELVTGTLHQNPTNSIATSICTNNSVLLRIIEC